MNENSVEILLVEDNPDDIELTMHALRKHNLANQVHVARDGAEALDYIFDEDRKPRLAKHPRLILLDLKLPKVSGLDVLKKLKSHRIARRIPVVVLTSSQQHPDIEESYNLGANSYIVKPVDFDKFVKVVGDLGFYWLLLNQFPTEDQR